MQRGLVFGAYYASEPRLESPDPLVTTFGPAAYSPAACGSACQYLLPVGHASFERHDRRSGVALAWERGAIAIGGGAELQQLDERIETPRALVTQATGQNERLFRRIHDRDVVPNAGIRWHATAKLALAAAYNGGGSFTRTTSACNLNGFDWTSCASNLAPIGASEVQMPDAFRAGLAFAATDRLRLIAEAVRRNYSTLAEDRFTIFNDTQRFPYRDVTELHAGAALHRSVRDRASLQRRCGSQCWQRASGRRV